MRKSQDGNYRENVEFDLTEIETLSPKCEEQDEEVVIPDGGWGWLVCCGTFVANFIVFGVHNSFGVVYANLLDELKIGEAETAWIGALAMGLNFLCGPLTSLLCDRFSPRSVAIIGGFLAILGFFLTSFVQEPTIMYFTYGVLFGVGSSFSFVSSIVILGDYFHKRLAFANGIASSGGGVGALVTGPVTNYLLNTIGWKNSMRILSAFTILLLVAAILYRPNRRIDKSCREKAKLFEPLIWKNKAYVCFVVTVALFQFGYLIPFVHLVRYAEGLGIPISKGAWLIGFLSITSTIGRILFGKLCDLKRINRIYMYQFSLFIIGVSTLMCPLATSYGGLIGYTLTFGLFDGCFVGQVAVITADIVGHENLSQGVGNLFGCLAIPMSFGPPVAGWLYKRSGSYNVAFFVSGSVAIFSTILIFFVSFLKKNNGPLTEIHERPVGQDQSQSDQDTCSDKGYRSALPYRNSSGYSSHSQSVDGQLLDEDNVGSKHYLKGSRLRTMFQKLEKETVL